MNNKFLNQGYVKKKNFLNNREKKDILKIIFLKKSKFQIKKNFQLKTKNFTRNLLI